MKKYLPRTLTNPQGFTLIELLVVIAIIAILAIIGFTVFQGVQARARNDTRRADVDAIAKALEVNKVDAGYVVLADAQFASGKIPATDPQNYSYCANSTASTKPADPTATWLTGTAPGTCPSSYGEVGTTNPPAGTAWKICTWLETETGTGANKAFCKGSAQ